jgi:glycosyltransferase involved in cell wall biosynthesis
MVITSPPRLEDLPAPPDGRSGWPWTEAPPALEPTKPDGSPWPRITIVTPSYNQGQFIEETIRSILLQGYPNLEYFVADDSTDETATVLERYGEWLTVLRGERRGMSAAINRGFHRATGDVITFVSSDDVYRPDAFRVVAEAFLAAPAAGAYVGAFQFQDAASRLAPQVHPPRCPFSGPVDLTTADPGSWRLHQVATFYGRATLDAVGCEVREDLRNNPDRELLYRTARHGGVVTIPLVLAAFRIHDHSKSWSASNMLPMTDEFAEVFLRFLDDDPAANTRRRRNARYHRAKGYTKFARHCPSRLAAASALLKASTFSPAFVAQKSYLEAWARVTGVDPLLRRLLGRSPAERTGVAA